MKYKMTKFIALLVVVFVQQITCKSVNYADTPPTSLDWRTKGVILPVTDNARGVHPAILNALDALSSMIAINTGKLVQLSAQQVYDCASDIWCPSCRAGSGCAKENYPSNATEVYQSIDRHQMEFNLESDKDYQWTGQCNHRCRKTNDTKYALNGFSWVTDDNNSENYLIDQLQNGPVVVDVSASCADLQMYVKGVFQSEKCKGVPDFTMLLVGYGTDNGQDYWILRNSWGTNWGEQGYIRVLRGKNILGVGYGFTQPMK